MIYICPDSRTRSGAVKTSGRAFGSSWFVIFCLCICVCVKNFLNCYFIVVQWSQWSSSPNCKSLAFGVVHEVFVVFAIFHFQAFDLLAAVEALCILLIMIFCIFKSTAKH